MNVYQVNVPWGRFAETASGGRYFGGHERGYDVEIYTELELAHERIAILAERGIKATLAPTREATDG